MIVLRNYQIKMIDEIRAAMSISKAIVAQLSTGAGKTALASEMISRIYKNGNMVFFIVHRKDLVFQTSSAFKDFNIPHSFIAAGRHFDKRMSVFICSVETLKRRLKNTPIPKIIFVDECHLSASDGWAEVIQFYKSKGCWIIGLSASPWRLDSKGLGCLFDKMICGPSMGELIKNGYLSSYKYYAPSRPDLSGVGIVAGDYNKKQLNDKINKDNKIVGNAISHYKKYANGLRAVVYCTSVAHSKRVAQEFCLAGISAKHMDGETPDNERRDIARKFANGEVHVICNVDLITTGYDLAMQSGKDVTIESIIMLRPTKSLSLYLQMVGRALRKKEHPAIILDHASNVIEHGLPCDEREWTLKDRERKAVGQKGEKILPVKECDKCHFCHHPAPKCPNCGYEYPVQSRKIEEVDGELAEIMSLAIKKEKKKEIWGAKTMDDLLRIERERGYKSGWAHIQAGIRGIRS